MDSVAGLFVVLAVVMIGLISSLVTAPGWRTLLGLAIVYASGIAALVHFAFSLGCPEQSLSCMESTGFAQVMVVQFCIAIGFVLLATALAKAAWLSTRARRLPSGSANP